MAVAVAVAVADADAAQGDQMGEAVGQGRSSKRYGHRLWPADSARGHDRSHGTSTAGAIRRASPAGLPTGWSAPPERLEPTRRVATVRG